MTTNAKAYLAKFASALEKAREHARSVFPEESCGFIVGGKYLPMTNTARDPSQHEEGNDDCTCRLCHFSIDDRKYMTYAAKLQAVVHSHPNGPAYPSKADMLSQTATSVAWIIVTLDDRHFGPEIVWGGDCPMEPLIGREFVHGVTDCYALIKDVFELGKEGMAKQGMEWPFDPIKLPVGERNNDWWDADTDNNLYQDNYASVGFVEISSSEVRPGDCFLGRIRSDRMNHAGVLLGNSLILHHLPNRLSRREPAGIWSRSADKWVRYVGKANA